MRMGTRATVVAATFLSLGFVAPATVDAQGRGRGNSPQPAPSPEVSVSASISLSVEEKAEIRAFYEANPRTGVEALPPGIRRNLERGKPLPPGIAKRTPPSALVSRITVPERYEVVEVGLDVFLVEVATGVIHDVLMDVIR